MLRRPARRPSRALLTRLALPAAALLTLICWALASPPGSSPDDTFHLPSIWCSAGTDDLCRPAADDSSRVIPTQLAEAPCFRFDASKSAACQNAFRDELMPDFSSNIGNWNGEYPPVFYRVMHPFAGHDLERSVLAMRIFNSLIFVGLLTALVAALPRRLRSIAPRAFLVTSVPLGMSVFASTNPSSWAVLGVGVLWLALYASFETTGRRRRALWAVALVATIVAAGSRADAGLFSLMAVILACILRSDRLRADRAGFAVGAACCVVAAGLFLTAGHASAVSGGLADGYARSPLNWHQLALENLRDLPTLWFGSLGTGNFSFIGWNDTPFPPIVGSLTMIAWVAITFTGWSSMSLRKGLVIGLAGAAMIVYPLVILGETGVNVGTGFQPRYLLPILVLFTGLALLPGTGRTARLSSFQRNALIVALGVGQAGALFTSLRRYLTGLDVGGFNLDAGREWWWGGPFSPMVVLLVGSVAFTTLAALILRPGASSPFADEAVLEPGDGDAAVVGRSAGEDPAVSGGTLASA